MADVAVTQAGGCRCGACRYVLALEAPPPAYCCHCRDCQTWSGSAFSMQGVVREDAVSATGPVVEYSFVSPSGSTSTQFVCGTCHTRLWNANSARTGIAVVRAGTLDASDALVPCMHIWTKRKQPWIVIADDVPAFGGNAPAAEFVAIMAAQAGGHGSLVDLLR